MFVLYVVLLCLKGALAVLVFVAGSVLFTTNPFLGFVCCMAGGVIFTQAIIDIKEDINAGRI